MDKEIKYLISKLEESFEGSPWYGDSMMEKLNSIDYRIVNNHTVIFTNSIANLVQHIINWRVYGIKKIEGDKDYDIELNSPDDWANIKINTESDWNILIDNLRRTQMDLVIILMTLTDSILEDQVSGRNYDFRFLIEGIIQHDIYHLGQIGLMTKLKSAS